MSLQICIMTPDKIFFNEPADEIVLPTNSGQIGVLANHAPLITALDIGAMAIRTQNTWNAVALMGGFALVQKNQVIVLVNEADSVATINKEEAEAAFNEAKLQFEQAQDPKLQVEANLAFKRARARYQLVKD
jgi:ATP synthase F1 epsilon subunit